jgi:hypothetical protein
MLSLPLQVLYLEQFIPSAVFVKLVTAFVASYFVLSPYSSSQVNFVEQCPKKDELIQLFTLLSVHHLRPKDHKKSKLLGNPRHK